MPHSPSNEGLRPLGWAGLLMDLPEDFRPHEIDGTAAQGRICLADSARPRRVEFHWETLRRPRHNATKVVTRKLRRWAGKKLRAGFEEVANPAFAPLLLSRDEEHGLDRCVGYCPATRRVVRCIYRHGSELENAQFHLTTLPGLRDQPLSGPSRWAFFGISFVAPAGFALAKQRLDLGNMTVRLFARSRESMGPALTIRQVYPANLALARRPLEKWHAEFVREFQKMYRAPGMGVTLRGEPDKIELDTPRGRTLASTSQLRVGLKLTRWWMPRDAKFWTIHDTAADRLIEIAITGDVMKLDGQFEEVVQGIHWAI